MSYNKRIEQGYKKLGLKLDKDGYVMKSIYFAHPFDKWNSNQEKMIEQILTKRGYDVINPFKKEDRINKKYGVNNYYDNPTFEFAKEIIEKDYELVKECDEYFGWFPKDVTMIGTPLELSWANSLGKKITVLCYKPQPFLWMYSDIFYIGYENFKNDVRFYDKEV